MAKRIKTKDEVKAKMTERVRTAGTYLKTGMEQAEDPVDVLLKDYDANAKKMTDGVAESVRTGKHRGGLQKAKERGSYHAATDRAATHFEERTDDMVAHSTEDYDARAQCQARARTLVQKMPTTTRAQRIAKGNAYLVEVGKEFDKLYNRKG